MSWQLASMAIVAFALVLAGWWYERSRPPAKLVAVVATLAALAALGRDAFAAIPDVKPITAIVLVSGVAFGAGPGFAVGATSALASNLLLGEGPWTPWQMLGWGAVGLIGGALGALCARRLPPLAIALACAAAAELFNLILDLYTWTGTGNHTFAAFGVVLGSALVFDATHVIASFAFGLAFGAVLLRMLMRVRARLHVSWAASEPGQGRGAAPASASSRVASGAGAGTVLGVLIAALALALPTVLGAFSVPARASASSAAPPGVIARALGYLARAQAPDGGFGADAGQPSSELYSAWAAIGLAAGGRAPLTLKRDGHDVLDALRAEAASIEGAGDLERTVLALRACGVSVRALAGGDPVTRLLHFRVGDGSFEHQVNLTAFAILALRAAGFGASSAVVRAAASWLARQQQVGGGFGYGAAQGAAGSDVDDTGAALEALAASGTRSGIVVRRALAYLRRAQNLDGGFPEQLGGASNAQSTAWAIQGIDAAGQQISLITRAGSRSPLGYLESLIAPDGSVRYSRTGAQTPVWVTAEALPALAGKPLPISPVVRTISSARGTSAAPHRGARRPRRTHVAVARTPIAVVAQPARAEAIARAVGTLMGEMLAPVAR